MKGLVHIQAEQAIIWTEVGRCSTDQMKTKRHTPSLALCMCWRAKRRMCQLLTVHWRSQDVWLGVSCHTLSTVKSEVELFILSQHHKQAMLALHCFCKQTRASLQIASLKLHVLMPNCLCASEPNSSPLNWQPCSPCFFTLCLSCSLH